MRSRWPWWLLGVAFVVVPLVEIFTIVTMGRWIGPWWTIALLLLAGVAGAWLMRREGARAWQAFTTALASGRMPAAEIADGALILIGGTLMLTPGSLSDVVGIALILPVTRPVARSVLTRVVARRLVVLPTTQQRPGPAPRDGVVRGEVIDD